MKLLEFQKKVNAIKKDGKNPHFKSTYATLTQIISEVKPILSECGVLLTQPIKDNKVGTVLIDDKGLLAESWIDLPIGLTPQQIGSAITYYRRYTLASLLALEIDDDDANLASVKPSQLPGLTAVQLKDAVKAIQDGKKDAVQKQLEKYALTPEQKSVIDLTIKNL